MKSAVFKLSAFATFGFVASIASAVPDVKNSTFETPANNNYGAVDNWDQLPLTSGNTGYAGGYLTGAEKAGGGVFDNGKTTGQAGFMQAYGPFGNESMSLTQTVAGFDDGQTYILSYDENSRVGTSKPNLQVFVKGISVVGLHSVTAVDTANTFTVPFRHVTSDPFTISGGASALVEFRTTTPVADGTKDATALIDNVTITAVPEPASLSMLGLGAMGLLARRRRS